MFKIELEKVAIIEYFAQNFAIIQNQSHKSVKTTKQADS